MLLRFKQFESTFIPKRISGRDEEAEKKGLLTYLKMAKNGDFKQLDWETSEHDAFNADFDANSDSRICAYFAYYEPIEDYLSMYFSIQYTDYLQNTSRGKYQLQISDPNGNTSLEQFTTFEDGYKQMSDYIGRVPKVYTVK